MENIGIIKFVKFILSFKHGRDFTAFLLFVIAVEATVIGIQHKENNDLRKENKVTTQKADEKVEKANEKLIDFLTTQSGDYSEMKKQIDSAKAQLEIFKIKKQMR